MLNDIYNQKYANDKFIKIREVCNRTGFCMQTIRNAIKKKELRGYLINNRWYTTELDYDRYMADTVCKSMFGVDSSKVIDALDKIESEEQKNNNSDYKKIKQPTNSNIDTTNLDLLKEIGKFLF